MEKHRQQKNEEKRIANDRKLIKNFVVDDDYESSSSLNDDNDDDDKINHESTRSSSTEGSTEDQQLFYIKTSQKLTKVSNSRKVNESPGFVNHRKNKLHLSSSEEDEVESESSSDSSIEYESSIKTKKILRRKNSESAIESVFKTPKLKRKHAIETNSLSFSY